MEAKTWSCERCVISSKSLVWTPVYYTFIFGVSLLLSLLIESDAIYCNIFVVSIFSNVFAVGIEILGFKKSNFHLYLLLSILLFLNNWSSFVKLNELNF